MKIFLPVVFLSALLPQVALATSYTVSITTDELDTSPSCITGSSTDCSLREALKLANANTSDDSTIVIPAGTYTLSITGIGISAGNEGGNTDDDLNVNGDLDITNTSKTITFQGANRTTTIVDGEGTSMQQRVFEVVANVEAIFEDLTIQDGNAQATSSDDGGAIYAAGDVTLSRVALQNNTSGGHGGGIYSLATTTIADSEVKDNIATHATDNLRGGGLAIDTGSLVMSGSEVSGNTITASSNTASGGGMYLASSTTVVITNSTIAGNTTTGTDSFGGGVYSADSTVNALLGNVTIANNAAEFGGGVYGPIQLSHVLLANNTASGSDADCSGTFTSQGYNIVETVSTNCLGITQTTDLTGSDGGIAATLTSATGADYFDFTNPASAAAVNIIPATNCQTVLGADPVDQLGNFRLGYCDVGAFEYQDTVAPTITITNDTNNNNQVLVGGTYTDAGAAAEDAIDGDLTSSIVTTNLVDTNTVGSYTVTYSSTDLTGNTRTAVRTVSVVTELVEFLEDDTIISVVKDAGTLTVTYADDSVVSFEPYNGQGSFDYAITSDSKRVVTTNGKSVRLFRYDTKVAQKKINAKKLKKKYTALKVKQLYTTKTYDDVMVVLAKRHSARVVHLRLTARDKFKKLKKKNITSEVRKPQTIKVKAAKHRFITKIGKKKQQVKAIWKVKTNGALKLIRTD